MSAVVSANLFRVISMFISAEATRYYLGGVLIQRHPVEGVFLVAADGHRMMVAHDETGTTTLDDVIVKLDKPTMAACKSAKGDPSARLLRVEGDGRASVVFDEADAYPMVTYREAIIDGTFPDWRRVLPSDDAESNPLAPSTFNATYIADFSKAAKELTDEKVGMVRTVAHGEGPALVLIPKSPNVFGVLMPMRGPNVAVTLPEWLNAYPQDEQALAA